MFKIKRYTFSPPPAVFFSVIITFILAALLKSKLLDVFSFPLKAASGFVSDFSALITYKFIQNENNNLKSQLSELARDAVLLDELRQENERLKKLLALKEGSLFLTVAAEVIAGFPDNWSRGVMIDKGAGAGIKVGNAVILESGLAGRVVEVSHRTAKIMLLDDPDSSVSAFLQRTREEGIISGNIAGGIQMRYLEKDSDVAIGDVILTSGLTRNYPSSLLIGRVSGINDDPQGLGKRCLVEPFVNLKNVEEVLVITGSK